MTFLRLLTAAAGLLLGVGPALAQSTYTWQPTANGNWNTAGNWQDQTGTAGVPQSAATTALVFNATGTQSYTATNDIGAFTLNRLTVNNTGTGTVTIAGAAANALTLAGTDPTLDITGTTLFTGLFAGSGTITKAGTGTFIHDSNNGGFTGTLVVNAGTFVNRDNANVGTNFNPVSIVVNGGGTYQFGDAAIGNPNLPNSTYITVNAGGTVLWDEGEDFGGVNLNGGTINLRAGGYNANGSTVQSWTSGTLNGIGAAAQGANGSASINKTTAGTVTVTGRASIGGTGTLNILEGSVVHVGAANLGGKAVALGNSAGTTAGTFEYQGATATRGGAFTLNAGGGTIAVTDAASTLTLTGDFSGTGNLTKAGAGTLYLTGVQNGFGTTTVAAGTLRLDPVTPGGGVVVANGATLAVNSGAGTGTLTVPTLALGDASSVVRFELNTASLPTSPLLTVSGFNGLTTGGTTLALTNQQGFATGTYTLIGYSGTPLSSGFALSLPGRTAGSLSYATTGQINAVITGSDTIRWGGQVNGTWDVGTAAGVGGTNNWRLTSNGNSTNFIQTDTVTFDDTASGNFTVTLGTTVNPSGVTVNNSTNDYTFTGAGGIGGTSGLTKSGTGRLTLDTNNTYTGTTTVNGGTLQVGNGGTTGTLGIGAVSLADGATLAFNRSDALTVSNSIATGAGSVTLSQLGAGEVTFASAVTGTGTITKTGTGSITLGANNNGFTGTLVINGGRIVLQDVSGGDLNAASIVVNDTGRFEFGGTTGGNPDLPANTVITVNTGGVAQFTIGEDYGAINLRGGAYNTGVNNNLGATSTFESGTLGNVAGVNGSLAGGGLVQKTTAGTVTVTGVALNGTGGLNIDQGVLSTDAAIGGSGVVRLGNVGAATLEYRGGNATVSRAVTLDTAGGTVGVTTAGTTYTLSGVLSGTGGLTKSGAGTLALSGANTYTGATAVNAGTLLITGNSASATGAITVGSGGTLGGTGTVGGATTVQSGGTIRGGSDATTGTLTTGNVTVNSSGAVLANLAAPGTSSQLAVGGNTLNLLTGSKLSLTTVAGFDRSAGSYTLATVTDGSTLQLDGAGQTNGFLFGRYVEGTGATGPVVIDTAALNFTLTAGDTFELNRVGNNLVLSFAPVPEPATVLAVGAAGLGLYGWVRRKRAK